MVQSSYAQSCTAVSTTALVATADAQLRSLLAMTLREHGIEVQESLCITPDSDLTSCRASLYVIDGDKNPAEAIETARHLRDCCITADSAIVLLSFCDAIEAYDAGVDLVLMKPVSMNIFLARVRSLLRRYAC